jgi:hypothetical protein
VIEGRLAKLATLYSKSIALHLYSLDASSDELPRKNRQQSRKISEDLRGVH